MTEKKHICGVGVIVAALVAGTLGEGCTSADRASMETSASTTTAPAPTTTSTTRAPSPAPDVVVATTEDGRLLVVMGGQTASADLGALRAPRLALAPDRRSAYLELWDGQDQTSLQLWTLTGRPAPAGEPFARGGRFPALSPDGRKLAYSRGRRFTSTLVVRDLATGAEKLWQWPDGHDLQQLSWAPDGRRLAIEDVVAEGGGTVVFDTSHAEGRVPDHPVLGGPYHRTTFRGRQGTLLAAQTEPGGLAPDRVVEVDAVTGAVRGTLVQTAVHVNRLDSDPSGDHVLIVGQNQALYQWSVGGQPSLRLQRVLDAAW